MSIDNELHQMVSEYRMESIGDIKAFKEWRKENGTKDGLLKLLKLQDSEYVIPSKRSDK